MGNQTSDMLVPTSDLRQGVREGLGSTCERYIRVSGKFWLLRVKVNWMKCSIGIYSLWNTCTVHQNKATAKGSHIVRKVRIMQGMWIVAECIVQSVLVSMAYIQVY